MELVVEGHFSVQSMQMYIQSIFSLLYSTFFSKKNLKKVITKSTPIDNRLNKKKKCLCRGQALSRKTSSPWTDQFPLRAHWLVSGPSFNWRVFCQQSEIQRLFWKDRLKNTFRIPISLSISFYYISSLFGKYNFLESVFDLSQSLINGKQNNTDHKFFFEIKVFSARSDVKKIKLNKFQNSNVF